MKATLENIQSLQEELNFYNSLTEEQAAEIYNVDYKAEAKQYIIDYWN